MFKMFRTLQYFEAVSNNHLIRVQVNVSWIISQTITYLTYTRTYLQMCINLKILKQQEMQYSDITLITFTLGIWKVFNCHLYIVIFELKSIFSQIIIA